MKLKLIVCMVNLDMLKSKLLLELHSSLLRTFGFFCDLYLQFTAPINLLNKSIDLRLFLKCKEGPVLRPLRSKDNRCWIFRLQPRDFAIIPESLAANLEKVGQTSV